MELIKIEILLLYWCATHDTFLDFSRVEYWKKEESHKSHPKWPLRLSSKSRRGLISLEMFLNLRKDFDVKTDINWTATLSFHASFDPQFFQQIRH